MNFKFIFSIIINLALVYSCKKDETKAIYKECQTINISYSTSSSLEDSELNYHAVLSYKYDSIIQYNLLVNDSILFFSYGYQHGTLDLKKLILDKNNPIDSYGFPTGSSAADLIPLFINDSTYLNDILNDTLENIHNTKTIGNIVLIQHYSNKSYAIDSMIKFINSNDFICFNRITHNIYFEFSVGNFSIGGFPFTQKDFKTYDYVKKNCSLENYTASIKQASEIKTNSEPYTKKELSIIPDFQFYSLDNKLFKSKKIKQKLVLLEFWYASCAPCLKNMQSLNILYSKYSTDKIKFIVLNDADKNTEKIKNIQQKYDLNYELYYRGESLKNELNIQAHPCTIIYDNYTRKILYKSTGTGGKYVKEVSYALDSLLQLF